MSTKQPIQHTIFRVPCGWLAAEATTNGLCRLSLPMPTRREAKRWLSGDSTPAAESHPILSRARRELVAYFGGEPVQFTVPIDLSALTPFRRRVLEALRRVPYGATESYGGLAASAGSPHAGRAVGQAMANNPIPIIAPCHRIIGAGGSLTGFGGGLDCKRALLALERGERPAARQLVQGPRS